MAIVDTLSDNLAAPTINGPLGGIQTLTPTLSWDTVSGASSYLLSLSDQTTNKSVISNLSLTTTSFPVPNGDIVNGHTYTWQVSSVNLAGVVGPNSVSTKAQFAVDTAISLNPTSLPGSTSERTRLLIKRSPATPQVERGRTLSRCRLVRFPRV